MSKWKHPLFHVWRMMIRRCTDVKATGYAHYGGRGITVCDRWFDFDAFCADVGSRPSAAHTLDRKDGNGPYSPSNCEWATSVEQNQHTARSRLITMNGETLSASAWARRFGISPITFRRRLDTGWPVELALGAPAVVGQRVRVPKIAELLRQHGISRSAFYARIEKGWTIEQALRTPHHQGRRRITPSTR